MPWTPRQTVWLGHSIPTFDSFDAGRCIYCSDRPGGTCCPPILMTLGSGHSGTTAMSEYLISSVPGLRFSSRGKETKVNWESQSDALLPGYLRLFPGTGTGTGTFGVDLTPSSGGECARRARMAAQQLRRLLPKTKFLVFVRNAADLMFSASYCVCRGLESQTSGF